MKLKKDKSITHLLTGLRAQLGANFFDVVDHWQSDPRAVGIARPDNHGVLIYISTNNAQGEACSVSLELPPPPPSDAPYTAAGNHEAASFDELAQMVRKHFGSA